MLDEADVIGTRAAHRPLKHGYAGRRWGGGERNPTRSRLGILNSCSEQTQSGRIACPGDCADDAGRVAMSNDRMTCSGRGRRSARSSRWKPAGCCRRVRRRSSFSPLPAGYFPVPSHPTVTVTASASTDLADGGDTPGQFRHPYGFGQARFGAFAGEADWEGSSDGQETGTVESTPASGTSDDATAASFESGHSSIHSFGRWPGGHVGLPDDAGGFGPSDAPQGYDAPQGFHYGFGGMHLPPAFFAAAAASGRGGPEIADNYADQQGGSAVFIIPGRGLPFGASPAIVIVSATAPPVAGPAFVFVPQPSGGSSGSSGTVSEGGGGYSSSSSAPAPRVPGRRAHPAAAQGPSDAGDPAPIPMSVAAAAAGTLRPAVDGDHASRAAAADAVAIVQTAVASAADSNGGAGRYGGHIRRVDGPRDRAHGRGPRRVRRRRNGRGAHCPSRLTPSRRLRRGSRRRGHARARPGPPGDGLHPLDRVGPADSGARGDGLFRFRSPSVRRVPIARARCDRPGEPVGRVRPPLAHYGRRQLGGDAGRLRLLQGDIRPPAGAVATDAHPGNGPDRGGRAAGGRDVVLLNCRREVVRQRASSGTDHRRFDLTAPAHSSSPPPPGSQCGGGVLLALGRVTIRPPRARRR